MSYPPVEAAAPAFRVNASNPITRGLAALFINNGGRLFDCVQTVLPTSHGGAYKSTARGPAFAYSNTQTQFAHVPNQEVLGPLSIAVWLDINALTNYGALISKGSGTGTNQPYELRLSGTATDGKLELLRATSSGFRSFNASTTTVAAVGNNQFLAVVASTGLVEDAPVFYFNGIEYAGVDTGSAGTGAPTGTAGPIYIAKRADGVTYLDGNILAIGVWNRALRKQEVDRLRPSPYTLIARRRPWLPVTVAGATTGALPIVGRGPGMALAGNGGGLAGNARMAA